MRGGCWRKCHSGGVKDNDGYSIRVAARGVLQERVEKRVFTEINLYHVRIRQNHIKTGGIQGSGCLPITIHNNLGKFRQSRQSTKRELQHYSPPFKKTLSSMSNENKNKTK